MPRSPRLAYKAPVMHAGYYNTDLKDQHRGAYQILGCFLPDAETIVSSVWLFHPFALQEETTKFSD